MDYIQKENRLIFHKLEVDLLQMLLIEWSSQIEQKNLLMLLMDYWTIPDTLTKITNIYTFIQVGEHHVQMLSHLRCLCLSVALHIQHMFIVIESVRQLESNSDWLS